MIHHARFVFVYILPKRSEVVPRACSVYNFFRNINVLQIIRHNYNIILFMQMKSVTEKSVSRVI